MTTIARILAVTVIVVTAAPGIARSQAKSTPGIGPDSVIVVAGPKFAAGSLHRKLLGDNYRDLWTMRIKLPVLHLATFAGGLTALREGGGKQTKSIRLGTSDSTEYVFRPVYKEGTNLPPETEGTIIWKVFRDQGSASHPGATVAAVPALEATRVLHPVPVLVVMGDDPRLGEFRKDFAGKVGTIEIYPSVPKAGGEPFAGAVEIIDSDTLLARINADPSNQIDAHTMLSARLVDMLLGDNDRHPGQWKWARLSKSADARWEPIARDRDKIFVAYHGMILSLARKAIPSLITFDETYPDLVALFQNAVEFDRRLLGGLDKATWDSTAASLTRTITDAVIDETISMMPREYAAASRHLAPTLRARRDRLPEAAARYYATLSSVVDVHATDASDRATIVRGADGSLDVTIRSRNDDPWFHRRFVPAETNEARVYLHDGNDSARITGNAPRGTVELRVIGGNGTNALADLSTVGGSGNPTHLYDAGTVDDVKYARDTVDERKDEATALNHYFNRRPWVHAFGTLIPSQKDRGTSIQPVLGLKTGHGLGLVPRIGIARYAYGFRRVPYSSMVGADIAYATGNRGLQVRAQGDKRFESSDVHLPLAAQMSQLEVIQFRGFGNDVPELGGKFYDVKQTQWEMRPSIGLSFAPESDVTFGPIVRYTKTDLTADRFIAQLHPYGFDTFGQVGLQLRAHYDTRAYPDTSKPRGVFELIGSGYPSMWDVSGAYEALEGVAVTYVTLPIPTRPVLAFRAGGKKLFGDFPYFDAAFLGGGSSFRIEHRQRYAGDASVYGAGELRVPVTKFPFILPLDVGVLGFMDAGRVYVDGESPGGWHTADGAGFWVGAMNPGTSVNVLFTNQPDHRMMVNLGFAF
ncbi:MAG: hypothetical protein ABI681_10570 [Gemmatimonadales bacterium]